MGKKILWMSRHEPHRRQIETLRNTYGGDTVVEQESRPFDDALQIAKRYREGHYDDMVIVAPLSVIQVLCNEGIRMLWSEAVEENDPSKVEFRGARGQGFRFVRFRRIKRVALEFED
jgi:predicted nucleic acid-binding protein